MSKGIETDKFAKVEVASSEALRYWLSQHFGQEESVWLVTFKSSVPDKYVSREDVLDELIAFGWIDGIRRKLDDERTMQLISPRKVQYWAKSYKERAAKLIEQGRMAASGYKSIEDGKASGLWNFMDDVDALTCPSDLLEAFKDYPPAADNFANFAPSAQRFTCVGSSLRKPKQRALNAYR